MDARGFERGTFSGTSRTSMAGGVAFSQDWDLEGAGNWPRFDNNGTVETRTHSDFNEIVAKGAATLTHDKNGNTTDDSVYAFAWDALNRLRTATKKGGVGEASPLVGTYVYDCHNRRMRKVVTNSGALNGTTDFYYDGWRVMEEHDAADAITQQYVYGNYLDEVWTLDNRRGGITVAQLNDGTGAQRLFYHCNTLYSVHGITDETGALIEAYQYDAYGKQTVITDGNDGDTVVNFGANDVRTVGGNSTVGNPYMYTGQRFDAETSLMYYKNRYHSTELGRFLSRDPIGYEGGGLNLYEYVGSSPSFFSDSLGTDKFTYADPDATPIPGRSITEIDIEINPQNLCNLLGLPRVIRVGVTVWVHAGGTGTTGWSNFSQVAGALGRVDIDGAAMPWATSGPGAPMSERNSVEAVYPQPPCPVRGRSFTGRIDLRDLTRGSNISQVYTYTWDYTCKLDCKGNCTIDQFNYSITRAYSNTITPGVGAPPPIPPTPPPGVGPPPRPTP